MTPIAGLDDVLPTAIRFDGTCCGLADAEFASQFHQCRAFCQPSAHCNDFGVSQHSLWIPFSDDALRFDDAKGVFDICASRNYLKIFDSVVVLHPVDVVDREALGDRTKKSFRNKAMDFSWVLNAIHGKVLTHIALLVHGCRQNLPRLCRATLPSAHYSALGRGGIVRLKPNDWLPCFHGYDRNIYAVQR